MTIITPMARASKATIQWTAIAQLVLSIFGVFLMLAAAGIFLLTGLSTYFSHGHNPADLTEPFMVAGSLLFAGALILPSVWYAWKQISNPGFQPAARVEKRGYGLVLTVVVFVITVLALLAGNRIAQNDQIAWLLLPPLNIIVTGLPALWLIYFGTRGLLPNSPRHKWGVFASGLVLGPAIILIAELVLLIVVFIVGALWLTQTNPSLSSQLPGLLSRLRSSGTDTQAILNSLLPYILNPTIIFLGFSFISVLVPIIEETFKPIGVWFMSSSKIIPAMGFGFGVLSGAGFGLFENLGNTSGAGTDWALLAGSRISTLLLHSFTAGLVGWGLASAWSQRRFIRLGFCFMAAVLIHGLWNGMAILSSAASFQSQATVHVPAILRPLGSFAALGVFALGAVVVFAFFGFNAYLRRSIRPEPDANLVESSSVLTGSGPSMPSSPEGPLLDSTENNLPPLPQPANEPPAGENDERRLDTGENNNTETGFLQ